MTFFDGSTNTNLGTETLMSGVATISLSTLAAGTHSISASYSGDSVTASSKSTTPLTQTVAQATASAVVTSSVDPSSVGQNVTFTATVTASGNLVISGNVTFIIDGGNANSVNGGFQYTTNLTNGQATYTVTALSKGSHTVFVNYTDPAGNGTTNATSRLSLVAQAGHCAALPVSGHRFIDIVDEPDGRQHPRHLDRRRLHVGQRRGHRFGGLRRVRLTRYSTLGSGTIAHRRHRYEPASTASTSTVGTQVITATYSGDSNFNTSSGHASTKQVRVRRRRRRADRDLDGNAPSVDLPSR